MFLLFYLVPKLSKYCLMPILLRKKKELIGEEQKYLSSYPKHIY